MKIAVVTSLLNAEDVLETFIEYHKRIGVDHIFLFFDDPNDQCFNRVSNLTSVTSFQNGMQLRKRWESTKAFDQFHPFIQREVMARQILNMEVAVQECLEKGIDWILHIDIDELFYSPSKTVHEHFEEMTKLGFENIQYLNHEAIPETLEIKNYFSEVTLFKRNLETIKNHTARIKDNRLTDTGDKYFLFYTNGKSAAKISKDLFPKGIREFHTTGDIKIVTDPCILHYPCCGISHFRRKYKTLKDFGDKWFGKDEIQELIPMHIASRNIIKDNDDVGIEKFYKEHFIDKPLSHLDDFLEKNIYFRINPNQTV